MPTVFDRIEEALSGNGVSGQVDVQVQALGTLGSTVQGLISNPPTGIQDLISSVRELPLPDIQVGDSLADTLASLQRAMPSDLSWVTGDVTAKIGELASAVTADLVTALQEGVGPILGLATLLQIDLGCFGPAPSGASGAGGEPDGATGEAGSPASNDGGAGGSGGGTGGGSGGGTSGSGGTNGDGGTSGATAAAPPQAVAALDSAATALSAFPSPLTAESLLEWVGGQLGLPAGTVPRRHSIPVLDDLRDILDTLVRWQGLSDADLAAELGATLAAAAVFVDESMSQAIGWLPTDVAALPGGLGGDLLRQVLDGLTAHLADLRAAVAAADLSATGATVSEMNGLLDQYDAGRAGIDAALGRVDGIATGLGRVSGDLQDWMEHVCFALTENDPLSGAQAADLSSLIPTDALDSIGNVLSSGVGWIQDLVAKLDLSAIQGPIQQVAQQAQGAADAVDSALVTVTTQVQHLFGEVESMIDRVDTDAIVAQVKTAIDGFKSAVTKELTELFAPVASVVKDVVDSIDHEVGAFDPGEIVQALEGAIDALAGVLSGSEVTQALDTITAAIDGAKQGLKTVSFTPVTDEVVGTIDQITRALQALDPSQLGMPAQLALQGAVALLPSDLTGVTNPIVDEFGQLVAGPESLTVSLQTPVGQLQAQVGGFEPAALVGDALSKPFEDVIEEMQAFAPSKLLEPLDRELDGLKDRLREEASPGRLLAPLEGPFDQLIAGLDALKPEDVVKPIEDSVNGVLGGIRNALPLDDVLGPVQAVLDRVREISDIATKVAALIQQARDMLKAVEDAGPGLETWTGSVLDRVAAMGDTGPVQAGAAALGASLQATAAAALSSRADAALHPLSTMLHDLAPQDGLTALIQAYQQVPGPALQALPDSPEKTTVTAVLDRLQPLSPGFAEPFERLATLGRAVDGARAGLSTALFGWDDRYHVANGPLACLRAIDTTAPALRAALEESAQSQFVGPVRAVLMLVAPARLFLEPVLSPIQLLVTDLVGKVDALLLGPGSIGAIKDSIEQLIDRLTHIDLGFITDNLSALFQRVRAKLEAISPAALGQLLDQAFADMLGTLDLSVVLPADQVGKLDQDFAAVITKLQALDPKNLVIDVVQPKFDQKIQPLLLAFDLSGLIQAVIDALDQLKGELAGELDRVNQSYKAMLAAVPSISPLSISVDAVADVGASVGGMF